MAERKKSVISLIPLMTMCIWSGFLLYNVLAGNHGDNELWRVICAVAGFVIVSGVTIFTLVFILKARKKYIEKL